MLRKQLFVLPILLFTAVASSTAQATGRPDTLVLGQGTLSGSWSAINGSRTYMGTWTAIPDTARDGAIGTWTLVDEHGATVAFGGWSAAKSATRWAGGWHANITGQAGAYSGTWTSSVGLNVTARFTELFATAAQSIVRGTWSSGDRSGAWAIRAAERRAPD